ncbi:hypothetical protein BJX61DRAFT_548457 [Aspergillus egyptiacus]|nr:hypothetical protein BJX61DRAFT_548457 [Aspergillus egyptiacus]
MSLICSGNLIALHNASARQVNELKDSASARYRTGPVGPKNNIPTPELFNVLHNKASAHINLPTISEVAIHLEMLEVFHKLRQDVIQSAELDSAFGISAQQRRGVTFEQKRKVKWEYFLSIAVVRFSQWIKVVEKKLQAGGVGMAHPIYMLLPPLDVLLIWHAFLSGGDDFREYCKRHDLKQIQGIVFPWSDIHTSIDSSTWTYTVSPDHKSWLSKTAGMDANLLEALVEGSKPGGVTRDLLSELRKEVFSSRKDASLDPLTRAINIAGTEKQQNKPLVDQALRQGDFVDKMHAHCWIRSPAVEGTLRRALSRYDKSLQLFQLYPEISLVSTMDVELVWRTHQCSADNYRKFATERVGRFIQEDDWTGRRMLNYDSMRAEGFYRLRYGEQYRVCLCWACEAILSAVEEVDDGGDGLEPTVVNDLAKKVRQQLDYYRELEIARRMGRELPIQDG